MKWKHDDGYDEVWVIPREIDDLIILGIKALKKYLGESQGSTIKGNLMANYPLNTGDSVVVTLAVTDDVTSAVDAFDAGSVTAVLSNPSDSVVVDPSGTFLTLTAGASGATGNTVTVNGTVGGVASKEWAGTYDDIAPAPDATTITGTFGTETPPAAPAAPAGGPAVGTAAGEINPVTGQINT